MTEQRLEQLEIKRRELEGTIDSVMRRTEVLMPRVDGTVIEMVVAATPTQDEDKTEDDIAVPGDGNTLLKSLAKKISSQPRDEAPLTTRAIRELEKAKRERVYSRTLIRVRFPDKVCIHGHFHPRDNIGSVYTWVNDCLRSTSELG